MMRIIFTVLFLVSLSAYAQTLTIFAASDLRFALDEVKKNFMKRYPNATVRTVYGSSGKGKVQIANGAPYDLYFSANMDYAEQLYKSGDIVTKPALYAVGRLVIWSAHRNFNAKSGFDNLNAPWVKKIAIANPSHAPYGEKAKEALERKELFDSLRSKIILGENISQTANFIKTKAADIGIVALSLVSTPMIAQSEYRDYYLIDDTLHRPLRQGYGITKYGEKNDLAYAFVRFLNTDTSRALMKRYGFSVPEKD